MARSADKAPVLSIIVRRFAPEQTHDIMRALDALQALANEQPGYLGDQNKLLEREDHVELINVFAFDSRQNLTAWEGSQARRRCLAELDRLPQQEMTLTRFDEFAELLVPRSAVGKIEIVVILIFWILALGALLGVIADRVLPATLPDFWRSALLISINVVLISYIFLPWSNRILTRLKTRLKARSTPPSTARRKTSGSRGPDDT